MKQSRRVFLNLLPAAALSLASEKQELLPSEATRYADPATEFPVLRLTDPKHTSWLPASYARSISRRSQFLLYSSDRSGSFQLYRMDLKTGQSRQLAEARTLDTASPNIMPDERNCCFIADGVISQVNFANLRKRELCQISDEFSPSGLCVTEDGQYAIFVETKAEVSRLRLLNIPKRTVTTVVESHQSVSGSQPRPKRAGILYTLANRELHVVNFDGAQNQRLHAAAGGLGPAFWSADGRTVDYLSYPEQRNLLHSIREYTPDTNDDHLISTTTQFVAFGGNADSSVFVGASGSKASPYVLLLVRTVKRELTLAEHKASDPVKVAPVFAPNSQSVFFQTDRHGNWAIYSMSVERLVEETE